MNTITTATDCCAMNEVESYHHPADCGCDICEGTVECGSDIGMTVALIDCIITTCRVLAPRLRMTCGDQEAGPIVEALRDLSQDKAVQWVWDHRPYSPDEETDAKLVERAKLFQVGKRSKKQEARLQELNAWVETLKYEPKAAESRFSGTMNDLIRNMVRDLPGRDLSGK